MKNNNPTITELIYMGRLDKKYSQRKLAKKIGIHHSTMNEIEKGNIKKPDVEVLRKISIELGIDLKLLLESAGYNQFSNLINFKDPGEEKYSEVLYYAKELERTQMDLLDDFTQKRNLVRKQRSRLQDLIKKYELSKESESFSLDIDTLMEEIIKINEDLKSAIQKYDYSKLPSKPY